MIAFLMTPFRRFRLKRWDEVFKRLVSIASSFIFLIDSAETRCISQWLISIHNAASAVADLITTGVLIYTLHQSRTGIDR